MTLVMLHFVGTHTPFLSHMMPALFSFSSSFHLFDPDSQVFAQAKNGIPLFTVHLWLSSLC